MKKQLYLAFLVLSSLILAYSTITYADSSKNYWKKQKPVYINGNSYGLYNQSSNRYPNNPHAGKVDSDGILSPGEIPNPLISYNPYHYRPIAYQNSGNYYNSNKYAYRPPYFKPGGPNFYKEKPKYYKGKYCDDDYNSRRPSYYNAPYYSAPKGPKAKGPHYNW